MSQQAFEQVNLGLFKLPGIKLPRNHIDHELLEEMVAWGKENGAKIMAEDGSLWSFRNEAQREWFILRWADHIPPVEDEE